jgi:carbamoyl-phosphate synthase large subunit
MKVLLIAAGRRVSLAQRFIKHGFDVYSYETEINCPISEVAIVIEGRYWSDPDIREHMVEVINDIKPNVVLPLSDHATPILSSIPYGGVITASGRTNSICLDKRKFEKKLQDHIYYPKVEPGVPVILKPIFGANSKGLMKVSYDEYLSSPHTETHVAQRFIDGFEISVDAYFNKYSQMIDAVPRKRIEVQGGEVSRSITLSRNAYGVADITKAIGEKIGLLGPICAQYIIENNLNPFIMEINSRFGGGVILSLEAGFDQIQLLKDEWVYNKPCNPQLHDWKPNFGMTRYFQEYFYDGDTND